MSNKIERLREKLNFSAYDAIIIEERTQRRYLTSFTSTEGTVVVTEDKAFLCVDTRYIEAARAGAKDCEVLLINGTKDFFKKLCQENGIRTAVTSGETTIARMRQLKDLFGIEISDNSELDDCIADTASIKDEEELSFIIKAQSITDSAFTYILDRIKPGRTDIELALELEFYMRSHGSEGIAFDTIFVSGHRTSMPHGVPSDKKIEPGDFITMDFGAKYMGYCSDMTRTVAVESVTDKQREVYDTVLAAQMNCLDNIKAGILGYESDHFARKVINEKGYGEYFGHGTGHSLGLNIHESPRSAPFDKNTFKVNQLMTVEPGIYLPGEFGVRIEDMVVLTEDGCINLTKSEKNLIIL